ncbi:response regulator [Eubacterium xylanophilum]|uniref:response regulator n=1 Tax=Eubacterium xylanophilum TaxID=39497 RepID=UPI000479935D|nr:response regulator [Eubacterium xylanophilum]
MATVLIIDDSRTSRKILRNILADDGYEVIGEAPDGQAGFEEYLKLNPDFVTLDITMPVLDGFGCLKKIMEHDKNAKVIMVTAAGQKSKMVEAIKLGASEFIQKPFEPNQILSVIKTVI